MLREPGVWLVVVECFRPLVHLVQPLVQTFCWLVKDRLLLLLVKCERRPGWWKQASVDGLRPVSLAGMCLHPASRDFFYCSAPSNFSFFFCHLLIWETIFLKALFHTGVEVEGGGVDGLLGGHYRKLGLATHLVWPRMATTCIPPP